jgi:hypothetical protein
LEIILEHQRRPLNHDGVFDQLLIMITTGFITMYLFIYLKVLDWSETQ